MSTSMIESSPGEAYSYKVFIRFCLPWLTNLFFDMLYHSEMLEAVGHEFMEEFFGCCESMLAPNGVLVLQVIAKTQ